MDDGYQRDGDGVNSDGVVSFAFFLREELLVFQQT